MSRLVVAGLAACLMAASLPARAVRVEPTEAALKVVEGLRARSMGVDRAGNLWAWDPQLRKVDFVSPSGEKVASIRTPEALAVDADTEWGVVALVRDGHELSWFRGGKAPDVHLRLDGLAAQVCWVGPATIAVAPQTAAYRIGIWSLQDKALVKTLGEETALHPAYGATRMRAVVMRYDFGHGLLYTLESYLGDLQVFTLDGKLTWRAAVDNPRRNQDDKWLLDIDQKAKEQRDIQTPVIYSVYLGLDHHGDPWVVRDLDLAAKTVSLVKLSPAGNVERKLTDQGCASRPLTFWGDWLIFFTDPVSPRVCSGGRRFS